MHHKEIEECAAARELRATELLKVTEGKGGALRAFALLLFGRTEEALAKAKKADAKLLQAFALLELGKDEEALKALENEKGGEAHALRASALQMLRRFKEAEREAEATLESADLDDFAAFILDPIFARRLDLLEKAVERFPESTLLKLERATILISLGILKELPNIEVKSLYELLFLVWWSESLKGPEYALTLLRSGRQFQGEVHYALKEAELLTKLNLREDARRALEGFDRRLIEDARRGLEFYDNRILNLILSSDARA